MSSRKGKRRPKASNAKPLPETISGERVRALADEMGDAIELLWQLVGHNGDQSTRFVARALDGLACQLVALAHGDAP